jgi:ribosomal protein S7
MDFSRAALEKSIAQADAGELIKFTYEEFLALSQKLHTERAA